MNDEIKVGEYARTDDGSIFRVTEVIKRFVFEQVINDTSYCFYPDDIIKHSPNILKVLENGDLVNGKYIVADIHSYGFYYLEDGGISQNQIDVGDIETVITKKQMERIMYRVEE